MRGHQIPNPDPEAVSGGSALKQDGIIMPVVSTCHTSDAQASPAPPFDSFVDD